jgi:hypothetical protein
MRWRDARILIVSLAIGGGVGIAALGVHGGSARADEAADELPTPRELLAALPRELTAEIPGDVDRALQAKLDDAKRFASEQLLFDLLSWRTFVALNWPVDDQGRPRPRVTDPGRKRWDTWKTDEDTYLPDGSNPGPWGRNHTNANFAVLGVPPGVRALRKLSAVHGPVNVVLPGQVGDVTQAFAYPIWDQNGFMLRYEIFLNEDEYDYIVANGLYSLDGQAAFSQKGGKVAFPVDDPHEHTRGAIEVKIAWKVLDESKGDLPGRFLTVKGVILTGADGTPVEKTLGLVGMHISHKTRSSPQWVWSTFLHVDSLQTDALATFEGKPIKPLFANPGDEIAAVNLPAQKTGVFLDGQTPTQVLQLTPIPLATRRVNRVARDALRDQHSVLQYYELLNTQWPTDPSAPPTPAGMLPDSINNKAGGRPTPVYLVNPLMETYFQVGNQAASNQEQSPSTDMTTVFGTESCMGCHSSAPVATAITVTGGKKSATFGPAFSGDFSWLLKRRAQFTK